MFKKDVKNLVNEKVESRNRMLNGKSASCSTYSCNEYFTTKSQPIPISACFM